MALDAQEPSHILRSTSLNSIELQEKINKLGLQIFQGAEGVGPSIFSKDWWYGNIMDWSMRNEQFKIQMFRFVDVLPSLNANSDVAQHLKEYFAEKSGELPAVFSFGAGLGTFAPGLLAGAVRKNVQQMARMFIAGENAREALPVLTKQRSKSIGFTVDILGEATLSETEAQEYQKMYGELIETLAAESRKWSDHLVLDQDSLGPIPKVNVSVKLSSIYSQTNTKAWDKSLNILKERLRLIFHLAMKNGVFLNVDMESYAIKDLTLAVFSELIMEPEFKSYPHFGIVIQAYLKEALKDCDQLIQLAKSRATPFSIRLVKGAYWDYETVLAAQKGWPCPVFEVKKQSDANFEVCAEKLLKAFPTIKVCLGSHNVRSLAAAIGTADHMGLTRSSYEIQMLYGMADTFKTSLVKMGFRVREYAPVGDLLPGMAYLVRRLLENTSNESFLRSKFSDKLDPLILLRDPREGLADPKPTGPRDRFENLPLLDFGIAANRKLFEEALKKVKTQLGLKVNPIINNKTINAVQSTDRLSPSDGKTVIAKVGMASIEQAEEAICVAKQQLSMWRFTPAEARAALLDRLADLLEKDRFEQAAWQVYEVGKQWTEADGDVAEAVDFCRYYARQMRELAKPKKVGHAPGETSHYIYQARGVAVVIAPWNFPLAILTGMIAAALVTGNTVVMKPAEQSSAVALKLMQKIIEAGFPPGVVQFLPGLGEVVGEYLVQHKDSSVIAFTGSKTVGLHIFQTASQVVAGQSHVKKCVIEMGGKNAVIVDTDADLDEAVQGIVYSAFGFQGQKCSACSRAIVLEGVYEKFLSRLVEATRSLFLGTAENPMNFMGPVVDQDSMERILKIIAKAKTTSKVAFEAEKKVDGYFVPPTIFSDVSPADPLAQEEIFGPVLAVIKVKNVDEALEIANNTEFALTGGLFSRSPQTIDKVKEKFEVGNLYINRGITGALVDRHPFGGFKMSGIGSKAGGPDYLLQFLEPKVVTENTMRRGFAPTEDV